jgi:hypothetical protein
MERHEMKARFESQIDEWKRNLDTMKAEAEASTGDAKVEYLKMVAESQKQFDGLKVQAAKTWDVADDLWDSTSKDLELKWEEWQLNAKKMWNDLTK